MVKFLILLALGLASSEKLDRTYLPPPGSKLAGGSPEDLQVPLEPPKETFPITYGQSGRTDGLPTLGDSQVELGISRGIPSESSPDLEISTPGTNTPFTYFQNAYNVPTTTTSYAFSQTTTLPPGQGYDITTGPFNPVTGFSTQNPTGIFQTTIRPHPLEQFNQNTPDYVKYGTQSTPRPEIVTPGIKPQSGYVYLTPEEQAANNDRPNYGPGTQSEFLNQYQDRQATTNVSPVNINQISSFVPSDNQQDTVYPYGQQPININQQSILPSTVSPISQRPTSNITIGNAVAPDFEQSFNQQSLFQSPYSPRPVSIDQQVTSTSIPPTGNPVQDQRLRPFQNLGQYQQNFVPSTDFQNTSGPTSGTTSQYDSNFNVQPFGSYGSKTPQSEISGQNTAQFITSSNVQSNQPMYDQNVYQSNEPGSIISNQNPSTISPFGDSNVFKEIQNVYSPTIMSAPGIALPNFSGYSAIPSSTPSIPSGAFYPGGIYSKTSTKSPVIPYEDTTSVRYKIQPERPQAEADRNAVILNYENVRTPEGYSYSFDTSNGIHADESGVVLDGTKAQGSYSYIGDDGKIYSVIYTADENGFQPRGDHLPTSPPIPEAIQRVIEQAARDRAAGISDDGSYDEAKHGHKKYQSKYYPQDHERILPNGADIPYMIEKQFDEMRIKQFRPQNNQIRPVSTTEDKYEFNDYGDKQEDYENEEIINNGNKNQPGYSDQAVENNNFDNLQGHISTHGTHNGFGNVPNKYLGSLQNGQYSNDELSSNNPSTENVISDAIKKSDNNQVGTTKGFKDSEIPQPSSALTDNTNLFDSSQTNVTSSFGNKNNQPSFNPRTDFTTRPIKEDIGYHYNRPENKLGQEGNQFPSRLMEINKTSSTRKPSALSPTTAKPFITPNIYENDNTEDDIGDQTLNKKPVYPEPGTLSKYEEGLFTEYVQSTTPDQIIGDDETSSYTTISAPRRQPSYNTQTTTGRNQYTDANDNGSPRTNQKGSLISGNNRNQGGNRYPSSTTFITQTPGFVSSTTPMPSTITTTLTPQRTSATNTYQSTYKPTFRPFSDKTISPAFSRPGYGTPTRLAGSTQGLPSSTIRPNYTVGVERVHKLAPGVKVDGFGRPIEQFNQQSDRAANPSITIDYPSGNNKNTGKTRPSSDVRGRQRPGSNDGTNTSFMPGVVRFSQTTTSVPGQNSRRPTPGYNQSTERINGEDFSGPKRPQTFDPKAGYHYK